MKFDRLPVAAGLCALLSLTWASVAVPGVHGLPRAPASAAAVPAPPADPAIAAAVDRKVEVLADGSDDDRRVAEDFLLNTPPQALPLIEAAAKRPGLDADTRQLLTRIAERLRPLNQRRAELARTQQEEYEWNLRTALESYDRFGRHDPKWDDAARAAIRLFVSRDLRERAKALDALEHLTSDLKCDDPLVLYFDARQLQTDAARQADREKEGRRNGQAVDTFTAACHFFEKSDYPADRKCFALLYAARLVQGTSANDVPKLKADARKWADAALALWPDVIKVPGISGRFLLNVSDLIVEVQGKCGSDRGAVADKMFAPYQQLFPDSPYPLVMKGRAYTEWAWDARGYGYASTVTPEGAKLFQVRLAAAAGALQKAYDKDPTDPRAAIAMLHVELGQGRGRDVMERWFRRAVEAYPDASLAASYPGGRDAYLWKMEYLQPRWYGSNEDVLAFGRECLATRNWDGRVTWLLVTAHDELARNARTAGGTEEAYFHDLKVWKDIEEVVGGCARIWPDYNFAASSYAYWAWKCGQWNLANQQFRKLGDRLDTSVFGTPEVAGQAKAESARRAAESR